MSNAMEPQHEQPKRSTGLRTCEVYGCQRDAQIYNNGLPNCRYHYGVAGKRLGHVTMLINNHAAEIDWYEHVLQTTITDYSEKTGREGKKYPGVVDATLPGSSSRRLLLTEAPAGMEPGHMEDFYHYRKRLARRIETLLEPLRIVA
jgi:hypothetical protein